MTKLLTAKQAAEQLGVSTSTIHRWDRKGVLRPDSLTANNHRRYDAEKLKRFSYDEKPNLPQNEVEAINETLKQLPPGGAMTWIVPQIQQYAGILQSMRRFYLSPDQAIRDSRENARTMFNNLIIREPLQSRMLSTAELGWHIEPPDKKSPAQMEVANDLQKVIEETKDFLKYRYNLLWATWFGMWGVQNRYRWSYSLGRKCLVVDDWQPVHGDSIVWKWDSDDVGIYVGVFAGAYPGTKVLDVEPAQISRAHVLTDQDATYFDEQGRPYRKLGMNERDAFVIHTHDYMPGDFLDPLSAGGVKGLGIRSVVYWTWYVLQQICGWMIEFMERVNVLPQQSAMAA